MILFIILVFTLFGIYQSYYMIKDWSSLSEESYIPISFFGMMIPCKYVVILLKACLFIEIGSVVICIKLMMLS